MKLTLSALETSLSRRYINLHFIYLLIYLLTMWNQVGQRTIRHNAFPVLALKSEDHKVYAFLLVAELSNVEYNSDSIGTAI